MRETDARDRFATARVAHLATVGADGRPHLVPIGFAVEGDTIYSAVDEAKPKSTLRLKRLRNIAAHPEVAVLADRYDEDWAALWWVRADGTARILERADDPDAERARALLADRYPQYGQALPPGPVIAIAVARWSGWSAR
jgi:PPOX class probable F420-dependent enzyme